MLLFWWMSLWGCECERVTQRNGQRTNPVWRSENLKNKQLIMKKLPITRNHGNRQEDWKHFDMSRRRREKWREELKFRERKGEGGESQTEESERASAAAARLMRVLRLCYLGSRCALLVCCTSTHSLITAEKNTTPGLPKQAVKHVVTRGYLLCRKWARRRHAVARMFSVKSRLKMKWKPGIITSSVVKISLKAHVLKSEENNNYHYDYYYYW